MSGQGVDSSFVVRAAEQVDAVLVFSTNLKGRYGTTPEPGSTADLEIFHNAERGPGGPWTPENVRRPYDISGGLLLMALGNYLRSLQLVLVPEMALYGFQVLARSIIEGAASAAWVLDPAINIRDRVIRAALLEHESILEARKVESAGGGDGSGYNKQILELRTRLALMGIAEYLNRKSVLIGFEGKTLAPKTDAASDLLRLLDIDHGEMWYRAISGVAHSVLYGVTQYLTGEPIPGTNRATLKPRLPLDAVIGAVVLSINAYLFVLQRHSFLWGRDAAAVDMMRRATSHELINAAVVAKAP